jgi:hypothetical protein
MQKAKLDEFNKLLKETNFVNVKQKAIDLNKKADICEKFFLTKKSEFDSRNYVSFLT